MRRLLSAIRIDILDAITAIRMGEWRYALPSCVFRRVFRADFKSVEEQCEEDTCTAHKVWCCDECFDMSIVAYIDIEAAMQTGDERERNGRNFD